MDQHSFGGAWTLIKLNVLKSYLPAFTTALSKRNFRLIYIDAFAGTGRCDVKMDGGQKKVDGSARIALQSQPSFHEHWFIELAAKKQQALESLAEEYPNHTIRVIRDDANAVLRNICQTYDWNNTRAVLFLDPKGMHVDWPTLEEVARTEAIDVWYLFPYSAFYRQAAKDLRSVDSDKEAALTRLMGTDGWKKQFYSPPSQLGLYGDDSEVRDVAHSKMLEYFSERLKGIFPEVAGPRILYQSGTREQPSGAPLFALYFAVSNPNPRARALAIKIAKHVLDAY